MKLLIVGDVHAKADDLADCQALDDLIQSVIVSETPDQIVYLGDQYDQFASKNVVVEKWWMDALDRKGIPRILITGNHDRSNDQAQTAHSLQSHIHNSVVIDQPRRFRDMGGQILFLPFYFRAEDFIAACNTEDSKKANIVFCHQSFIGANYESGSPVDERHDASAVNPKAVPQKCIIAGHIHSPQQTGKVWYPGSPRWRNNVSDSNLERYIYVVTIENGNLTGIKSFPTGDSCRRIWSVADFEGQAIQIPTDKIKPTDKLIVDVTGTLCYIEERKRFWGRPGVRIRTFQTDRPGPKLSESQGVGVAWKTWMDEYQPRFKTDKNILARIASERVTL